MTEINFSFLSRAEFPAWIPASTSQRLYSPSVHTETFHSCAHSKFFLVPCGRARPFSQSKRRTSHLLTDNTLPNNVFRLFVLFFPFHFPCCLASRPLSCFLNEPRRTTPSCAEHGPEMREVCNLDYAELRTQLAHGISRELELQHSLFFVPPSLCIFFLPHLLSSHAASS